jgi:photosystem II stability/assembly factor-like uncharacterized protein
MATKLRVINLRFLIVIPAFLLLSVSADSQERALWQNLNPQFQQKGPRSKLGGSIVATSAYFLDDSNGWVVGTNGGWLRRSRGMRAITHDGGKTWNTEFSNSPSIYSDVIFVSKRTGWILAGMTSRRRMGKGMLLETRDSGRSWRRRIIENFESSDFLATDFVGREKGYIAGSVGVAGEHRAAIFKTTNGGKNWSLIYQGNRAGLLRAIKFDDSGEVGWAVGDDGEIVCTRDGGNTWSEQKVGFDGILLGIAIIDPREAWIAASDFTLLHTIDGGNTWDAGSPRTTPNPPGDSTVWFSGIFFKDKNTGWICGSDGMILSTQDGGKTWRLDTAEGDFLYRIVRADKYLFAVGKDSVVLRKTL